MSSCRPCPSLGAEDGKADDVVVTNGVPFKVSWSASKEEERRDEMLSEGAPLSEDNVLPSLQSLGTYPGESGSRGGGELLRL